MIVDVVLNPADFDDDATQGAGSGGRGMTEEKTVFVRILSGNMGDGWKNNNEAARAYAKWLEKEKNVEIEVLGNTSGVGGGSFDADGNETTDGNEWWREWCESADAAQLME